MWLAVRNHLKYSTVTWSTVSIKYPIQTILLNREGEFSFCVRSRFKVHSQSVLHSSENQEIMTFSCLTWSLSKVRAKLPSRVHKIQQPPDNTVSRETQVRYSDRPALLSVFQTMLSSKEQRVCMGKYPISLKQEWVIFKAHILCHRRSRRHFQRAGEMA